MRFWEIKNKTEEEAELSLYGEIRGQRPIWDGEKRIDAIIPNELRDALDGCKNKKQLSIKLYSGGGDVFAAHAIYCKLKSLGIPIRLEIEGIAASAATIILAAADTVLSAPNNLVMIHNPQMLAYDYLDEHDAQRLRQSLITVKDSIIEAYVGKCKKTRDEIVEMMDEETWMTGRQAQEAGFVDQLLYDKKADLAVTNDKRFLVVNHVAMDCTGFKNFPGISEIKEQDKGQEELIMEFQNSAELEAAFPELAKSIRKEAEESERTRLQEIDQISVCIPAELVNKAKYEQPVDAKTLSFQALAEQQAAGKQYLAGTAEDRKSAESVGAGDPGATAGALPDKPKAPTLDSQFQDCVMDILNGEGMGC